MTHIKYLLSIVALGATLASCEKNEVNNGEIGGEVGNKNTIVISSTISSEDTRSSLDGLQFSWVTGDKLSVSGATVANAEFSLTSSPGAKSDFSGNLEIANAEFLYAIYPYAADRFVSDGAAVKSTIALPVVQSQDFNAGGTLDIESLGAHAYMYGKSTNPVSVTGEHTVNNMSMHHLMTIFDFELSGIEAGKKVYSLVLRSRANNKFVGSVDVSFSQDGVPVVTSSTTSMQDNIQVDLTTDGVAGVTVGSEPLKVRLAMFAQPVLAGNEWIVEVKTNSDWTNVPNGQNNTTRNEYAASMVFENNKTYVQGGRYKVPLALNATNRVTMSTSGAWHNPLHRSLSGTMSHFVLDGGMSQGEYNNDFKKGVGNQKMVTVDLSRATGLPTGQKPTEGRVIPYLTFSVFIEGSETKRDLVLESVKLPSDLHSIGYDAFSGCTTLKTVEFPATTEPFEIAERIFFGCTSLKSVKFQGSTPFELSATAKTLGIFKDNPADMIIYVPVDAVDDYKAVLGDYASKVKGF